MVFQSQHWVPLTERRDDKHPAPWLAASFATLGFSWDCQYTVPQQSNRAPWVTWKIAPAPDPAFAPWIVNQGKHADEIIALLRKGKLDKLDPDHPVLLNFSAIQNYYRLLHAQRTGETELMTVRRGASSIHLVTPASERYKLADASSDGASGNLATVSILEFAAALVTVGFRACWSLSRWQPGAAAIRFEPRALDGTSFADAMRTAIAINRDHQRAAAMTQKISAPLTPTEAPLGDKHPFRCAYNAVLNVIAMEKQKSEIIRNHKTLFLQAKDHPMRSALIGQQEFEDDRDLVFRHLRGRL